MKLSQIMDGAQEKHFDKRRVVINTASRLYDKFLNIYIIQYDKLSENVKKSISVLDRPENVTLDVDEVD